MNKNIGETYWTEEFGYVIVVDIYVSLSTQERVYKVKTVTEEPNEISQEFLLEGVSLLS